MSFSRPEKQAVMPRRSVIDSNDSLFNPKKVFTIVDAIDHPPSSYTLSSRGSDFAHEYSFENQNLDIYKKPHPMSSTTNTTSSVDVDEEDVSLYLSSISYRAEWHSQYYHLDPQKCKVSNENFYCIQILFYCFWHVISQLGIVKFDEILKLEIAAVSALCWLSQFCNLKKK